MLKGSVMKSRIFWGTVFGLVLALLTANIVVGTTPILTPFLGDVFTESYTYVGVPFNVIVIHNWFQVGQDYDYPNFRTQDFSTIGLVLNWLIYSLVATLFLGGWKEIKEFFSSVDGKKITSRLSLAAGILVTLMATISPWLILTAIAFLNLAMLLELDANEKLLLLRKGKGGKWARRQ